MRTSEGMAVAPAKGWLRGKQSKLSPAQQRHLVSLQEAGQHTQAEPAELFNVSRTLFTRHSLEPNKPP